MLATETQDAPTQKPNATWSPKKASRHAHGHPPSPNKWGSGSSHPSKWSLHIHSRPPSIQCHRCHTDLLEWKAGRCPAHTSSLMCDVWCHVIITDLTVPENNGRRSSLTSPGSSTSTPRLWLSTPPTGGHTAAHTCPLPSKYLFHTSGA